MKKYLYSVLIMAIFAIGFAASSDDSSSSSSKSPEEQKQSKIERVKNEGYHDGYKQGFGVSENVYKYDTDNNYEKLKASARRWFSVAYGAPSSNDQKELYKVYEEAWIKGYEEGYRAQ